MLVPLLRTLASTRDFSRAFIAAWRNMYLRFPTKDQCKVIYAQWQVETGGSACWNWNIGNVKVTPAQVEADVPYVDLPGTWEIINGKKVILSPGDPGRRFRAYASLDAGMTEHLTFLRNKRYAPAWPYVEAGDCDGFARTLKRQGYFTASADDYAKLMVSRAVPFMSSDAFEQALLAAINSSEDVTQPDVSQPIVHASPFQEPEPDDAA